MVFGTQFGKLIRKDCPVRIQVAEPVNNTERNLQRLKETASSCYIGSSEFQGDNLLKTKSHRRRGDERGDHMSRL